jgi:hypothetical protein
VTREVVEIVFVRFSCAAEYTRAIVPISESVASRIMYLPLYVGLQPVELEKLLNINTNL